MMMTHKFQIAALIKMEDVPHHIIIQPERYIVTGIPIRNRVPVIPLILPIRRTGVCSWRNVYTEMLCKEMAIPMINKETVSIVAVTDI